MVQVHVPRRQVWGRVMERSLLAARDAATGEAAPSGVGRSGTRGGRRQVLRSLPRASSVITLTCTTLPYSPKRSASSSSTTPKGRLPTYARNAARASAGFPAAIRSFISCGYSTSSMSSGSRASRATD